MIPSEIAPLAQTAEPRTVWGPTCEEARLPGRLFHDFRRTAVRNTVRAGLPERVAIAVSGHKSRIVFDRYNIVNEDDLKKASQKGKRYHDDKVNLKNGHNLGPVEAQQAQIQSAGQPAIH